MRSLDREPPIRPREEPAPSEAAIGEAGTLDVLALQRTAGNHAVAALLEDAGDASRPPASAVLGRMTVTAALPPGGGGVFTSVSVSSRASTGYARGQGSHTTAYVTFVDMIKLRVVGHTPAQAAQNLVDLYNELMLLPGAAINNANSIYCKDKPTRPPRRRLRTRIDGRSRTRSRSS